MSFIEAVQHFPKITPVILSFGVIFGLYTFKRNDSIHRSILLYLTFMLIVDLTARALKMYFGSNQIILPVFSLIELIFFIYFYKRHFFKTKQWFLTVLGMLGALYIIWEILFNFIFNKVHASQFQPYSKVVDNFIIILFALAFFHEKINRFKESKWDNFQLNTVLVIFFTLNLIFFLPFNFLVNERTGLKFYFWIANLFLTISFYIYLIYSIWKNAHDIKPLPYKKTVK